MSFRRVLCAAFSSALLLGLAWGCAAADSSGDASPGSSGTGGIIDPGKDASVIAVDGPQDSGSLGLNPLCGAIKNCVPDLPRSCEGYEPPATTQDASAGDGAPQANGQAGAQGEGGFGGDSPVSSSAGAAGEGGTLGAGDFGSGGAFGEAGTAGAAGGSGLPPAAPEYSCQVQRSVDAPTEMFSRCAPAGTGAENAPCLTSRDCQPGLGCVGAGICQKYCCQDADDCERGTYCAERPMRDALINALPKDVALDKAPLIPVFVHAENCDLGAPYPCPKGSQCTCESDTACLVVRSDGTTTCAVPGSGKIGDACPCAWGYVCSAATNRCLQLCSTRNSGSCGTGKCQAASELP